MVAAGLGGADINADASGAFLIPGTCPPTPATVVEVGAEVDTPALAGGLARRTGEDALPLLAAITGVARPATPATMIGVLLEVDAFAIAQPFPGRARFAPDLALALANLCPANPGATLPVKMARFAIDQAGSRPRRVRQPAAGKRGKQCAEDAAP
jgi:hypothetical protein